MHALFSNPHVRLLRPAEAVARLNAENAAAAVAAAAAGAAGAPALTASSAPAAAWALASMQAVPHGHFGAAAPAASAPAAPKAALGGRGAGRGRAEKNCKKCRTPMKGQSSAGCWCKAWALGPSDAPIPVGRTLPGGE
jgi:hypothetical protein